MPLQYTSYGPKYPTVELLKAILDASERFLEAWNTYQDYEKAQASRKELFHARSEPTTAALELDCALSAWYFDPERTRKAPTVTGWPLEVSTALGVLRDFTNPIIRAERLHRSRPFNAKNPLQKIDSRFHRVFDGQNLIRLMEPRINLIEIAIGVLRRAIRGAGEAKEGGTEAGTGKKAGKRGIPVEEANVKVRPEETSHSEDFTSVCWYGTRYQFAKGQQAEAVKLLWTEWKKGRHSLSEQTIREKVDSSADRFRLAKVFRTRDGKPHPAFGTMIKSVSKGTFALVPPE